MPGHTELLGIQVVLAELERWGLAVLSPRHSWHPMWGSWQWEDAQESTQTRDPNMPGGPPQEGDAWRGARGHCEARLRDARCACKTETAPGRLLWCVACVRDSCSSCPPLAGEGAFRNPNRLAGPQCGREEIITNPQ